MASPGYPYRNRNALYFGVGILGLMFAIGGFIYANWHDDQSSVYFSPVGGIQSMSESPAESVHPDQEIPYEERARYLSAALKRRADLAYSLQHLGYESLTDGEQHNASEGHPDVQRAHQKLKELDSLLADSQDLSRQDWPDQRRRIDQTVHELALLVENLDQG
jgi:hypothetical protein